jgi:hypothetical protein
MFIAFRQQYVDAYINFLLNESVQVPYNAFHDAFHHVCGGRVLVGVATYA